MPSSHKHMRIDPFSGKVQAFLVFIAFAIYMNMPCEKNIQFFLISFLVTEICGFFLIGLLSSDQ